HCPQKVTHCQRYKTGRGTGLRPEAQCAGGGFSREKCGRGIPGPHATPLRTPGRRSRPGTYSSQKPNHLQVCRVARTEPPGCVGEKSCSIARRGVIHMGERIDNSGHRSCCAPLFSLPDVFVKRSETCAQIFKHAEERPGSAAAARRLG